jgi:hypothetical protein
MTTTTANFFFLAESNRVHPSQLPARSATAQVPSGLTPWQMISIVREQGLALPLGSARTGVHEIQTDEGVWTRLSANRRERSEWTFRNWFELETAEALEA